MCRLEVGSSGRCENELLETSSGNFAAQKPTEPELPRAGEAFGALVMPQLGPFPYMLWCKSWTCFVYSHK